MAPELLIHCDELPWVAVVPGIDFRLLYASQETGRWTVLFRCQPGSSFPIHQHHGAGEYFVLRGRMIYRAGEATTGTSGYEPVGVIHEHTLFPEYTELYFTNYGPVAFLGENGSISLLLDHTRLIALRDAHLASQSGAQG